MKPGTMFSSGEKISLWEDLTILPCFRQRNLPDKFTLKLSWKTNKPEVLWAAWVAASVSMMRLMTPRRKLLSLKMMKRLKNKLRSKT